MTARGSKVGGGVAVPGESVQAEKWILENVLGLAKRVLSRGTI